MLWTKGFASRRSERAINRISITTHAPDAGTGPWVWLYLLAFASQFFHCVTEGLYLHLPGYILALGGTEFLIGTIAGAASVGALLARPPAGRAVDHIGRRAVFIMGGAAHVVSAVALIYVESLGPLIFVARTLHGFSQAAISGALLTYVADILPLRQRTQGIAIFTMTGMAAIGIAGPLGDVLLSRGSYELLFLVASGAAVLGLVATLPLPETRLQTDGEDSGFVRALLRESLIPVWIVAWCFSLALATVFTFAKVYIESETTATMGSFFAVYAVSAAAVRLLFGWVPQRLGTHRVLLGSMGLFAVGQLLLYLAQGNTGVMLSGIAVGSAHGYITPILSTLAVQRCPRPSRGSSVAVLIGLIDIGPLIVGPVLGSFAELAGYRAMFLVNAAIPVFGVGMFWLLDPDRANLPAVDDQNDLPNSTSQR